MAAAVELSATDNSTITVKAGAGALAVAISPTGAGLAAGIVTDNNQVNNTVESFIGQVTGPDSTTVTSAGGVLVSATTPKTKLTATGVAVAAAGAASLAGAILMLRYFPGVAEIGIGENGETPHNDQIIEISPAEEGASPWSWSPIRCRVSRGGSGRWD